MSRRPRKYCAHCGAKLGPETSVQWRGYCGEECEEAARRNVPRRMTQKPGGLSSATTGALHELLACADLVSRGYDVFRAVSPSCPCDLIAMRDGNLFRVEVTTGNPAKTKPFVYPKKIPARFDLLAVVVTGSVHYPVGQVAPYLEGFHAR